GTNNCRLLVANASATGFDVTDSFSRPVRLGERLTDTGALCDDAIGRTLAALEVCAEKMRRGRVTRSRHIATEACRRATNGQAFLDIVRERTGLVFDVISAREEARLAVSSCQQLLDPTRPRALLVDIGGGSTEVVWIALDDRPPTVCGVDPAIRDMVSIPWGVVTLTEARTTGLARDAALPEGVYEAMLRQIDDALAPFCARNGVRREIEADRVQMIGASGTVTTMAAHNMGLRRYARNAVDGTVIARDAVMRICARLSGMSVASLTQEPCIGEERAELALAGGAILEAVCRRWPVPRIVVADRGLREGVLADLMRQADRDCDPLRRFDDDTAASAG
ncbi:MAG: Ppx/GppA family phosphatase, partial [Rhodospirillales bacterium]|nr:Ppx/GppA family phosphatase [Rhodospirillales bacterium]